MRRFLVAVAAALCLGSLTAPAAHAADPELITVTLDDGAIVVDSLGQIQFTADGIVTNAHTGLFTFDTLNPPVNILVTFTTASGGALCSDHPNSSGDLSCTHTLPPNDPRVAELLLTGYRSTTSAPGNFTSNKGCGAVAGTPGLPTVGLPACPTPPLGSPSQPGDQTVTLLAQPSKVQVGTPSRFYGSARTRINGVNTEGVKVWYFDQNNRLLCVAVSDDDGEAKCSNFEDPYNEVTTLQAALLPLPALLGGGYYALVRRECPPVAGCYGTAILIGTVTT